MYKFLQAMDVFLSFFQHQVEQLSCSDGDAGTTLSYVFFSGNTGNDFSIDGTGLIETANGISIFSQIW